MTLQELEETYDQLSNAITLLEDKNASMTDTDLSEAIRVLREELDDVDETICEYRQIKMDIEKARTGELF